MERARQFDKSGWERQLRCGGSANGVHIEAIDGGESRIWLIDRSEEYLAIIKPEYRCGGSLIRVVERGPESWEVSSTVSEQLLGQFPTRKEAFRFGRAQVFLDMNELSGAKTRRHTDRTHEQANGGLFITAGLVVASLAAFYFWSTIHS